MKPMLTLAAGVLALALAGASTSAMAAAAAAPPASKVKGEACMRQQQLACAEANFKGYLKANPNDTRTRALLAITLTDAGKHAESLPVYEQVMAEGEGTYDLFANYAISLDATGKLEESMEWNRKTLELVPQLVDVRGTLARQLVRQGKREEAIALLEEFDAYLKEKGQNPYFTGQIIAIKASMKPKG